MFKEYDVVKLREDMPSANLSTHDIGAIVMVYDSDPPEYEVEFVDAMGHTLALLTLHEQAIVPVQAEEPRPAFPTNAAIA